MHMTSLSLSWSTCFVDSHYCTAVVTCLCLQQGAASPEHSLEMRSSDDAAQTRRQYFSIVQERGHEEVEALPYDIP